MAEEDDLWVLLFNCQYYKTVAHLALAATRTVTLQFVACLTFKQDNKVLP